MCFISLGLLQTCCHAQGTDINHKWKQNCCLASRYSSEAAGTFDALFVCLFLTDIALSFSLLQLCEFVEPMQGAVVCVTEMGSYIVMVHETGFLRIVDINSVYVHGRESFLHKWPEDSIICEMEVDIVGTPTVAIHPATYLNKLLIATNEGAWYIVNFRTKTLVYKSENFLQSVSHGKTENNAKKQRLNNGGTNTRGERNAITSVEQSPALDVIAFGLSTGEILIHDVKRDELITSFAHSAADSLSAAGSVSALSFCTDPMQKPLLLSATDEGAYALWDLKEKVLHHVDRFAHRGNICAAWFLPKQTSYVTLGTDNAIKMWTLDSLDLKPKLLRNREGHCAPPRQIRYYAGNTVATLSDGADARVCEVLSAGDDCTFRMFHTAIDRQNRELSQKSINKRAKSLNKHPDELKLAPIIDFACSERHHGLYYDVVTAHKGDSQAYVWSYDRKTLGDVALPLPHLDNEGNNRTGPTDESVTSVTISRCGNFAIIGGSQGTISKFNLQSGAPRGEYPLVRKKDKLAMQGKRFRGTHSNPLPRPDRDVGKGLGPRDKLQVPDSVDRSLRALLGKEFTLPSERDTNVPGMVAAAGKSSLDNAIQKHTRQSEIDAVTSGYDLSNIATWRHVGEIRGLFVSRMNDELYSAGADGTIRWWDLGEHKVTHILYTGNPVTKAELHVGNGLLGIACDDHSLRIVDTITRRQVRKFPGHTALISDLKFSADGRWLVSASHDSSVKVWDIPTARCIDWMKFEKPVRCLAVSPTNEYLITSHSDDVGLYMWSNKSHFSDILQDKAPSRPILMDLPRTQKEENTIIPEEDQEADSEPTTHEEKVTDVVPTVKTKNSIVLAGKPSSQWQNLSKLDEIAKRNKPKEPPKEPERAPFFLPTVAGVNPVFEVPEKKHKDATESEERNTTKPGSSSSTGTTSQKKSGHLPWGQMELPPEEEVFGDKIGESKNTDAAANSDSRVIRSTGSKTRRSRLSQLLQSLNDVYAQSVLTAFEDGDPDYDSVEAFEALHAVEEYLTNLTPAKVDVEVRSLCLDGSDQVGRNNLRKLLVYFLWQLQHLRCFEVTQAQLQLTLKIYPFIIAADQSLRTVAQYLRDAQNRASEKSEALFHHSLCLIKYFSNIQ